MNEDKGFEVEQGQEVVDRTIVGGRPRSRRSRRIAIPIGIEKALTRADGDIDFRRRVFDDRQAALAWAGYELTGSEAMIWKVVPDQTLRTMIDRIDLKQHTKRRFLKGVATAVFASAALTSAVSCVGEEEMAAGGMLPYDASGETMDVQEIFPDVGTDFGDVVPDVPEVFPDAGVDIQDVAEFEMSAGTDIQPPDVPPIDVPEVFPDAGVPPDVPPDAPDEIDAPEVFPVGIDPEM